MSGVDEIKRFIEEQNEKIMERIEGGIENKTQLTKIKNIVVLNKQNEPINIVVFDLGLFIQILSFFIALPYMIYYMGLRLLSSARKKLKINRNGYINKFLEFFKFPTKIRRNLILTFFAPINYEPKVVHLLKKTAGKLFVDIGANVGFYSILLAPQYRNVIAIEPEPRNIGELRRNTQGLTNIHLMDYAISDRDGYAKLFLGSKSWMHSLLDKHGGDYIRVPTRALGNLFPDKKIDLIKVDVQGAELQVLRGAEKIMNNIYSWIIEVHNLEQKVFFEKLLGSYNYDCLWVDSKHLFAIRKY